MVILSVINPYSDAFIVTLSVVVTNVIKLSVVAPLCILSQDLRPPELIKFLQILFPQVF